MIRKDLNSGDFIKRASWGKYYEVAQIGAMKFELIDPNNGDVYWYKLSELSHYIKQEVQENVMKKTKEIKVWVHKDAILDPDGFMIHKHAKHANRVRAKLIIEIPEKKVEITESLAEVVLRKYITSSTLYTLDDALNDLGFKK